MLGVELASLICIGWSECCWDCSGGIVAAIFMSSSIHHFSDFHMFLILSLKTRIALYLFQVSLGFACGLLGEKFMLFTWILWSAFAWGRFFEGVAWKKDINFGTFFACGFGWGEFLGLTGRGVN